MKRFLVAVLAAFAVVVAYGSLTGPTIAQAPVPSSPAKTELATFAGGCFWCVEADFDKIDGVTSTVSGFMGGTTPNPSYKSVTAGGTGHLEVVQIAFDPAKVSYQKLVDHFWRTVDPTDAGGQFCDRGDSYLTGIFAHNPEQKRIAEGSKVVIDKSGMLKQPIVTPIRDAGAFTPAEEYHQDFHTKNPIRYKYYRHGCGRDARLEALWGRKAGH